MRDEILEILKNTKGALSDKEVSKVLNDRYNLQDIRKELDKLCNEFEIYHTKKKKYLLFGNGPISKGVIEVNKKGFGFVRRDFGEDIYVSSDNMGEALNKDLVVVETLKEEIDPKNKNLKRYEGRILKVLKKGRVRLVGELYDYDGELVVVPDDEKLKLNIYLNPEDLKGQVAGNKILVEIEEKINKNVYHGKLLKLLGHKNDPGVDILAMIEEAEVPTKFSDETMESLKYIKDYVSQEEMKGRKDLRNLLTVTIDGDDTKDIDDAISIEKENDNYRLTVHIADVAYYVKEGTALDQDAYLRGNSYYLVDRVIPMYPHQLSNGICSLNEGVDRLAFSCEMLIDKNANIIEYDIYPSVINSNKRMTYKKVNDFLENKVIDESYEPYVDMLMYMNELSKILRKDKNKKGYIDFAIDEVEIFVDEKGHPLDIKKRERGRGENIIEDFMIIANEVVARHIFNMDLPFLYRVHEEPDTKRVEETTSFITSLGHQINVRMDKITPKTMQLLLNDLKESEDYQVISKKVLRTMAKAKYISQNLGHFGLASDCYTHFTAPIRRYSDTTVHRLLHTYLVENNFDSNTINKWTKKLEEIGEQTSNTERISIDLERDVDKMKMAEYMEDHVGEEFEGIISGLANFGMFVELDNLVEGLVPIDTMPGYFTYDKNREMLTSGNISYRLGERVKVRVDRASKEDSSIDFSLAMIKKKEAKKNHAKVKKINKRGIKKWR